jgi:hypothetical protein
MKRLLFVALMMICSVSWAEWEYIGENDTHTDYFDKSTIRRNGRIAKMWILTDYLQVKTLPDGTKFRSKKVRRAYNCLEESITEISTILFSGSMGEGDVVWTGENKEIEWNWMSVVPRSVGKVQFDIACGKK